MVLAKRKGESILNIVGSLSGSAWRLVEDFDVSKAEEDNAFQDLMKLLDQHFEYDSRVQLPSDFDGYFNLSRRAGQTLLSFVTEHDELNRRLEKHNVTLPDAVQGWHLLRKANLTREQKQLITLRAPRLEKKKVIEALYLVLGQDFKAGGHHHGADRRGFHGHRSFKQRGYVAQDEDALEYEYDDGEWSVDYGDGAYYEWDGDDPDAAGEPWPYEEDFDSQAAYFQTETEDAPEENFPSWQDVDSYDAA